jgi:hypothetical protein
MRFMGSDKEILDFLFGRDTDWPAPSVARLRLAAAPYAWCMEALAHGKSAGVFQYTRIIPACYQP